MNIWDHPQIIAEEALSHLESALIIGSLCAKDLSAEFNQRSNGYKIGSVLNFKTHGEYQATEFTGTIAPQAIRASERPMTIEKMFDISVQVTSTESAMDLDSFSEQVIKPAMYSLGATCDAYLGSKILEAQGMYVSGSLLNSAEDIAQARKTAILQQLSMNRFCLVDLDLEATLLGQTWFNQALTRGAAGIQTLQEGEMGRVMGMDFHSSISFPTNATAFAAGNGTALTDCSVSTNNIISSTVLTIKGGSAGVFKAGDRLAIAGVKRPVIVSVTTAALAGVTQVGLVQPITEVIPDSAAITVIGSAQNLTYMGAIFDDKSLAVAFPMLDLPADKVCAVATNNGVTVRIVRGYDMQTKVDTLSMDFLVGAFLLDTRRVTLLAQHS